MPRFTLPDLPRGAYTLVGDRDRSDHRRIEERRPVTFNVLRPSLLSPQHK